MARYIDLQRDAQVLRIKPFDCGDDVVLADEAVGSLRACDEVRLEAQQRWTRRRDRLAAG